VTKPLSLVLCLLSVNLALPSRVAAGDADSDRAELAKALADGKVSLRRALFDTIEAGKGRPISAQYEVEGGQLELSVYMESEGKFTEVIVNHKYGVLERAQPITEGEDLAAAKAETEAMAKAKLNLADAVGRAEAANKGFRAVRIVPSLKDGRPIAQVLLFNGAWKTVVEPLD
jgi:hypothetical protein